MTAALIWAWQHHVLQVREADDLFDAIQSAGWASDDGQESLDCVEVWDDAGHRVISASEILNRWYEIDRAAQAATPASGPPSSKVVVVSPSGKDAVDGWFSDDERAADRAAELRKLLGSDRVRVERDA